MNILRRLKRADSGLLHDAQRVEEDWDRIREALTNDPSDRNARLRLLGRAWASADKTEAQALVFWFIRHEPRTFLGQYGLLRRREGYEEGRQLWLAEVARYPDDPDVLENAAWYLSIEEAELGALLLEERAMRDGGSDWCLRLAIYLDFVIPLQPAGIVPGFAARLLKAGYRMFRLESGVEPCLPLLSVMRARALTASLRDGYRILFIAERAGDTWKRADELTRLQLASVIRGLIAVVEDDKDRAEAQFHEATMVPALPTEALTLLATELVACGRTSAVVAASELWASRLPEYSEALAVWRATIRPGERLKPPMFKIGPRRG